MPYIRLQHGHYGGRIMSPASTAAAWLSGLSGNRTRRMAVASRREGAHGRLRLRGQQQQGRGRMAGCDCGGGSNRGGGAWPAATAGVAAATAAAHSWAGMTTREKKRGRGRRGAAAISRCCPVASLPLHIYCSYTSAVPSWAPASPLQYGPYVQRGHGRVAE